MSNSFGDGESPDPHTETSAFPPHSTGDGESHLIVTGLETPGIAPEPHSPVETPGTEVHSSIPTAGKREVPTAHRADWDNWGVDSTKRAGKLEHNPFSKMLFRLKGDRAKPDWAPWDNDETVVQGQTYGNDQLWSLGRVCTKAWEELRAQLRGIILHTPGRSNNSSTAVVLQSFLVGDDRAHLQPTVYISASSHSYAKTLRGVIQRSGVLDIDNVQFDVKIMNQHLESSERPRMRLGLGRIKIPSLEVGFKKNQDPLTRGWL
ncbi:hypothetical protein Z517_00761 [Fonsecaea pedrosoi CBS 271.37]|uniref:Uncharacterized protein n=1 Tax=Fonsecaea pedrosoi CBS 271.37 TaxID=1442368 RepID=A0A0D2E5K5_9EURO|nr:uncharacterized protein Z517_00761 [Fonsecaea pedrosoi CBS 271.37]KIW85371.1 hypothetical protein Z517_00761 [Fonsecaea pedrosoi CBS 271.37]